MTGVQTCALPIYIVLSWGLIKSNLVENFELTKVQKTIKKTLEITRVWRLKIDTFVGFGKDLIRNLGNQIYSIGSPNLKLLES